MIVTDVAGNSGGRGLLSLDPGLDDDDSYEEDIFDEKEMFSSTQLCNMVNAKSPPSSSSSSESEESDTEERRPSLENDDPLFFTHGNLYPSDDGGVVRGPERRALSELKDNKTAHVVSEDEDSDDEDASESLLANREESGDVVLQSETDVPAFIPGEAVDSSMARQSGDIGGRLSDDDEVCTLM
jgi:hypothetical protein